jgi:AcrR family transcriptional regulator
MRLRDEQKELLVRTKALELLVEEGFNGFSMHKLAKAANVSPATLYIYFQNKEDLIVQLGIEVGQKIQEVTFEDLILRQVLKMVYGCNGKTERNMYLKIL